MEQINAKKNTMQIKWDKIQLRISMKHKGYPVGWKCTDFIIIVLIIKQNDFNRTFLNKFTSDLISNAIDWKKIDFFFSPINEMSSDQSTVVVSIKISTWVHDSSFGHLSKWLLAS